MTPEVGPDLAQPAEDLEPVQVGQLDVEHDDTELRVLRELERLGPGHGVDVRDARLVEGLPDHLPEESLVVHDQDARSVLRHGSPIGRQAYKM